MANSSSPVPAIWYVTAGGREQGPFTTQQMRTLVAQGKISVATPVRKEGMTAAVPAASVDGLLSGSSANAAPASAPRPLPEPGPRRQNAVVSPERQVAAAADDHEASYDQQELPEDEGDDSVGANPRASVGIRLLSGVIDYVLISIGVFIVFAVLAMVSVAPMLRYQVAVVEQWQKEIALVADNNHAQHFKRILGIENFPTIRQPLVIDGELTTVDGQIQQLIRQFDEVAEVSPPDMVANEVIYAWRERRALTGAVTAVSAEVAAEARRTPITDQERNEVVQWRQYEEFVTYVQNSEAAIRRNLRQYGDHFRAIEQRLKLQGEELASSIAFSVLLVLVIGLPLIFLAVPICELLLGGSVGKVLFGYRVTTLKGKPVGLIAVLLRQILRLIPFGFVTVFMAERQALHDMLSGTQVIPKSMVQSSGRGRGARGGRQRGTATIRAGTGTVSKTRAGGRSRSRTRHR